jgi:calcium-dependent phosphoinositide phospholipase C
MLTKHLCRGVLVAAAAAVAAAVFATGTASAADTGSLKLSQATTVGVHNTYNKDDYPYLAQALDAGSSLIELDVWDDILTGKWKVSHDDPLGDDNNCVAASDASQLYSGRQNQDLSACLSDIKLWLSAHPDAGPVYVKLEMKAGLDNNAGMGPDELDSYIANAVGTDDVYRPADLLGGTYATLDAAAQANAWPTRGALAGKMVIYLIPGTFELANPTDSLHTDVEYGTYIKNLYAAGTVGNAMAFPCVLGAMAGDPRSQYTDASIRPWFVVFDGDASTYVSSVDTSWYDTNHYLLIMTDAQNVSPPIDGTNPPVADAQARVEELAADHASVVSSDWYGLPDVLSMQLTRG